MEHALVSANTTFFFIKIITATTLNATSVTMPDVKKKQNVTCIIQRVSKNENKMQVYLYAYKTK